MGIRFECVEVWFGIFLWQKIHVMDNKQKDIFTWTLLELQFRYGKEKSKQKANTKAKKKAKKKNTRIKKKQKKYFLCCLCTAVYSSLCTFAHLTRLIKHTYKTKRKKRITFQKRCTTSTTRVHQIFYVQLKKLFTSLCRANNPEGKSFIFIFFVLKLMSFMFYCLSLLWI